MSTVREDPASAASRRLACSSDCRRSPTFALHCAHQRRAGRVGTDEQAAGGDAEYRVGIAPVRLGGLDRCGQRVPAATSRPRPTEGGNAGDRGQPDRDDERERDRQRMIRVQAPTKHVASRLQSPSIPRSAASCGRCRAEITYASTGLSTRGVGVQRSRELAGHRWWPVPAAQSSVWLGMVTIGRQREVAEDDPDVLASPACTTQLRARLDQEVEFPTAHWE
jgi:hypothetical protein